MIYISVWNRFVCVLCSFIINGLEIIYFWDVFKIIIYVNRIWICIKENFYLLIKCFFFILFVKCRNLLNNINVYCNEVIEVV